MASTSSHYRGWHRVSELRGVKMAPGATEFTPLPFTGLNYPEGLAIDKGGNVYVVDRQNKRVLKLPVN